MSGNVSAPRMRLLDHGVGQQKLTELQDRIALLEQGMQALAKQLRTLAVDYEAAKFFREEAGWIYDVAGPNFYFNSVYHAEILEGGGRKRWVDQTGRIAHGVHLPRHIPYRLRIDIVDFALDTYADKLRLRVDGRETEWTSSDNKIFTALVPPLPHAFKIDFEVFIAPEALTAGQTVSFSFAQIVVGQL